MKIQQTKYKPYPEYKAANAGWLDMVPEHWQVKRTKFIFEIRKRIAGKLGYDVLAITQQGIKVKNITDGGGQLSLDYSKYQIVENGDFAMNHMDLLTGYVDISCYNGVTSPDYRVFSLIDTNSTARYFLYLYQMGYKNKILYAYGQGSSQLGRWRLPADEFKNFKLPIPPLAEQNAIASFLDKKCAQIDSLIEENSKLLMLLDEQKQIIINDAVTGKVKIEELTQNGKTTYTAPPRPDSDMKNSNIDWLEKVPGDWSIRRLKFLSKIKTGEKDTVDRDDKGIYPFFVRSDNIEKIGSFSYDGEAVLTAGDGAGVAKVFHYVNEKFDYHQRVYKISDFKKILGKYFYFYMKSQFHKEVMRLSAKTTVDSLRLPMLQNFIVTYTTLAQQQLIVNYIEQELSKLDEEKKQVEREIELMKEYKTVLISEAVTGKIDVRKFKL